MNYSRNKQPGKERPYTFYEFLQTIIELCKEQDVPCVNELEYFNDSDHSLNWKDKIFVNDYDIDVVSETTFGGCEGIYSHFYILMRGKRIDFAVAKNLSSTDETFVNMSIFAAKFCLLARNYTWEHGEDFNWSGYDAGYENEDGKFVARMICGKLDHAESFAKEYKEQGLKAVIRDNSTKKMIFV